MLGLLEQGDDLSKESDRQNTGFFFFFFGGAGGGGVGFFTLFVL